MALNKKSVFPESSQKAALFAKAFSHPARLEILGYIAQYHSISCSEIVEKTPLAQSTVSRHLKELVEAGLLEVRTFGPKSFFSVNRAALKDFWQTFQNTVDGIVEVGKEPTVFPISPV